MFKQEYYSRFVQGILLMGIIFFFLLPPVKANQSPNDLQYGKTLLKKGQKLNQHRQPDQAYLACTEAVRLLKQSSPEDYMLARLGQADALLQMSAVFCCFKQMQEDEAYLKKHFKPSDKIYVRFNQLKGELHFTNREVEEALEVWHKARKLALKHYGPNSSEYAARLTDIGKCYIAGNRLDSSYK